MVYKRETASSRGAADSTKAERPERNIMDEIFENNPITESEEVPEHQDGGQEEAEDLHESETDAEGEHAEGSDGQKAAGKPGDGGRAATQTHADNAAAKAARLRAERDTEARVNREVDEDIRKMGLVDPYTNRPIRTRAELNAYSQRAQEEQIRERAERENRPASDIRREMENQMLAEQKRQEMDEEKSKKDEQARRQAFLEADVADFMSRYPDVDIMALQGNPTFRRFAGTRFGREPLGDLYEDYVAITGGAAAAQKAQSKSARAVGGGTGTAGSGLTAAQQRELEQWNRRNPEMKMTAKEFLSR